MHVEISSRLTCTVLCQLMATGESGANGARVQKRANKESNREHVNVIPLLLSTVDKNVKDSQKKLKSATKKSHAQVSWDPLVYLLCCDFERIQGKILKLSK